MKFVIWKKRPVLTMLQPFEAQQTGKGTVVRLVKFNPKK